MHARSHLDSKDKSDSRVILKATSKVSYLKTFLNFFPDVYRFVKNPDKFVLETLPQRAGDDNIAYANIFPGANFINGICRYFGKDFGLPAKVYVVVGNKTNVARIADFSETNPNSHSRDIFHFMTALIGKETLINWHGRTAFNERGMVKANLNAQDAAETVHSLFQSLLVNWDESISYQNQMVGMIAKLVSKVFLGIPDISIAHIPGFRKILEAVFDIGSDAKKLTVSAQGMNSFNERILSANFTKLEPNKFIRQDIMFAIENECEAEAILILEQKYGAPLKPEIKKEKLHP